jgi:hypothetical protein
MRQLTHQTNSAATAAGGHAFRDFQQKRVNLGHALFRLLCLLSSYICTAIGNFGPVVFSATAIDIPRGVRGPWGVPVCNYIHQQDLLTVDVRPGGTSTVPRGYIVVSHKNTTNEKHFENFSKKNEFES